MKTSFIRLKRTSLLMTALFLLTMTNAQKYYITFDGYGDASTVQNVTVENLTQKTSLTLPGDQTLVLNLGDVGIREINTQTTQQLTIYPNPSNGTSFMQFGLPHEGNVDICLYDMAGKLHKQSTFFLQEGIHTLTLPSMATGVYLLSVRSTEYSGFGKWVSMAGEQSAGENIQHTKSAPLTEKETTKTSKAANEDEYTMEYTENDLLRFTGQSGNYRTIVMKRPTESQQIDFRFIACTDACGKHYPVVEIAGVYWMAEDLTCDHDAKGKYHFIASGFQMWADNTSKKGIITFKDFGAYAPLYGTFFNYEAALASIPEGWALPKKEDFEVLFATMGRDGADIALGLLKDGHDTLTLWNDIPASDYRNETGFGAKATGYISITPEHMGKNIGVAYWTSTDSAYIVTPYITKNNVKFTATSKYSGMKVRCIAATDPLETLQNVFGTLKTNTASDQKPVGDTCVMEDNGKKLFIALGTTHSGTANFVRRVDDINAAHTGSVSASVNLPSVPQDSIWCSNKIKKAVSQRNIDGRENLVIATLNINAQQYQSYNSESATTTLYIFNDSVNNYAPTVVNLTGSLPVANVRKYDHRDVGIWGISGHEGRYASMYWFYDIKTCDVNGDMIEDFILVSHSRIAIYDGKTYNLITWNDFSGDHIYPDGGLDAYAFYTRVAIGDVNQDGKDDIVVLTCVPKDTTTYPKLHVFLDGDVANPAKHKIISLPIGYSALGVNVAMGDVNGDRKKEIVFNGKTLVGELSIYSITMDANNNFSPISTLVSNAMTGVWTRMEHINMVYFDGLMADPYIASGGKVFQKQGGTWGELKINNGADSNVLIENISNIGVLADQATVSDYFGDSREHLVYLVQDFTHSQIYTFRFGKEGNDFTLRKRLYIYNNNNDYLNGFNSLVFPTIATVRSNRAARALAYKRYEYTYSNIQVDAVLAAAPYRTGTMSSGSTYWGKSSSSGSQTESEYTTSASAIFGFEQEFTIPVVSQTVGGIDFTTKMSFGYTRGYSNATTITRSTVYTLTGENGVVVSTIPYHSYFYTILKSDDPKEIGKELMMAFPDKRVEKILTIDEYKENTKGDPNTPRLDNIFKHTIGNPESYPQSETGLSNAGNMSFCYTGSSFQQVSPTGSGTATSDVSITISQEQAQSTAMSFDVDVELVVNVGGVKFGGGFGFGSTNKVTKTVGQSTSAGGNVICPPSTVQGFTDFDWNIVFYNYMSNGIIFPVVNFLVD